MDYLQQEHNKKRSQYEYIIKPLEEFKKELLKKGIIIKEIQCEWEYIDIQILWVQIQSNTPTVSE